MRYKAVFTDMDGTLLRKDHTVSAHTRNIIRNLTEEGILVIPASARPLHGMLHITEGVFPASVPIISLNGSYILHHNKIIHDLHLAHTDAAFIHEVAARYPVSVMHYSKMEWHAGELTAAVKKEQRITPVAVEVEPMTKTVERWAANGSGPNKTLIAGDEKVILEVERALLDSIGSRANIFKSQPRYLEAMHQDASKTNAMQLVMDMYGLQQDEVIAIGDNYNDAGMIAFAGMGIAMGNAPEDIKAIAGHVTDTNNHDGVAKALEYFFH